MNNAPEKITWTSTAEAAKALQVSPYTLRNRMRPYLKQGDSGHYKPKNPAAKQKRWLWHVPRLLKWQGGEGDQGDS